MQPLWMLVGPRYTQKQYFGVDPVGGVEAGRQTIGPAACRQGIPAVSISLMPSGLGNLINTNLLKISPEK